MASLQHDRGAANLKKIRSHQSHSHFPRILPKFAMGAPNFMIAIFIFLATVPASFGATQKALAMHLFVGTTTCTGTPSQIIYSPKQDGCAEKKIYTSSTTFYMASDSYTWTSTQFTKTSYGSPTVVDLDCSGAPQPGVQTTTLGSQGCTGGTGTSGGVPTEMSTFYELADMPIDAGQLPVGGMKYLVYGSRDCSGGVYICAAFGGGLPVGCTMETGGGLWTKASVVGGKIMMFRGYPSDTCETGKWTSAQTFGGGLPVGQLGTCTPSPNATQAVSYLVEQGTCPDGTASSAHSSATVAVSAMVAAAFVVAAVM